ncbi:hypothetical protein [Streptosporangium sp. NPDC000396]|uniref:hypothetical protein n=1 Tax=Streptosporangium sp. NPDC000396 TaxID=3366185 RepID=UPI00367DA552
MSRTDNTMPARIQEEDGKTFFTRGGAYAGVGEDCNIYERRARQRVRLMLLRGEEPEPTRHRRSAKWMY